VEGGWGDHSVRGVVGIPAERIVSYVLHAHHRATAAKVQPRGLRRLKFKIVFSFKTDKFLATISFNILHVIFIKKKSFSFEGGQICQGPKNSAQKGPLGINLYNRCCMQTIDSLGTLIFIR
jgi:hypothetical protein